MATIKFTIDNIEVEIEGGGTVLEAARKAGIYIPALCAHPDLPPAPGLKAESLVYLGGQPCQGSDSGMEYKGCRLCVVEVGGMEQPQTSCDLLAADGMTVSTNTPQIQALRRANLKAILAGHPHACLTCSQREGCSPFESCPNSLPVLERCCSKLGYCELGAVASYIGIADDTPRYIHRELPVKKDEPLFTQDYNLCIGCTRCVRVCRDLRGVGALGFVSRDGAVIAGPVAPTLKESGCKFCGACVEVCPTGALLDRDIRRAEREAALIPCTHTCPAGIDVPRYVRLIAEGKFAEALAVIREKVPFPGVLGRVCFHPCEASCRRGQLNEPIAIRELKRFAAEQNEDSLMFGSVADPTGKKVAVVGSGPAGLTAGYYLAKLGHAVTVFEAFPEPGGMMRVGIPQYRLPRELLDREIEGIKKAGVEIETNSRIESLDTLWERGYDAVYLATGAHRGVRMEIAGEDTPGVIDCVSFLRDVNQKKEVKLGRKVAVIGGGNAAIDAARTALRLGAGEVTVIYRRSGEEMPASPEETEEALEEGVSILFLTAPKRVSGVNGSLVLECLRMELGEPDSSGRRRPEPVEGSEYEIDFETIIAAVGQMPEIPDGMELDVIGGGRVKVKPETSAANNNGVYAGGDAVTGPASVVEAIAAGRKAAVSIDRYLGGSGDIGEVLAGPEETGPSLGRDEGFHDSRRVQSPGLPLEKRMEGFSGVTLGFNETMACGEAGRCLRCDLRLQISQMMLPPDELPGFTAENVEAAPETDGVYRLFDEQKEVIFIGSGTSIREGLQEILDSGDDWVERTKYLHFEETLMYTMRETELIQQFLQEHGRLPEGNDEFF